MRSVADTSALVLGRVPRPVAQQVDLDDAHGRILAADVVAPRALPGFDNSAMDGYAARSAELPATLPIAQTIGAGATPQVLAPGTIARIFTGAMLPPGADTVVIQEDVRDGALPASPLGDNVRRTGEDVAIGETVLRAGTRIGPAEIGMLAALGVTRVDVARAPRVAIIATGDELVDAATAPGPGQSVRSSSYALAALIRDAGGLPHDFGIAKDDAAAIAAMIGSALQHDVVLTTGGVSVGDRDFVHAALAQAGVTLEAYKVAMKPGKPFSFGVAGTTLVFGLPGNPVSTHVAFELFVRPALLAMQGATTVQRPRAPVALAGGYRKTPGRAHYLRARVVRDGARLIAHPHAKQGSAMLSSLLGCNALVEIPADATDIAPDAVVQAVLWEAV